MKHFKPLNFLKAALLAGFLVGILYSPGEAVAATTTVSVSAPAGITPGQTFTVNVNATPGSALSGMQFDLAYNSSLLTFVKVEEGTLLTQSGAATFFQAGTAATGVIRAVSGVIITPGKSAFSEGVFARVTFTAKALTGVAPLTLSNVVLGDVNGQAMTAAVTNGQVTVGQAASITVTSPNGGENWAWSTSRAITWTSSNVTGNVKIELLKGGSVVRTISSATAVTAGTRTWSVPSTQAVGSDYSIRITSTSVTTVTDTSNANFTISSTAPATTTTTPPTTTTTTPPTTSTAPPASGSLHVQNVTVTQTTYRVGSSTYVRGIAAITVVDEHGSAVSGATVTGQWSGSATDSDTGVTDSSGKASVSSNLIKQKDGLSFSFNVTNIVKSGYSYNGGAAPPPATTTPPTTTTTAPVVSHWLHVKSIGMSLLPYNVGGTSYVRAMAAVTVVNANGANVSGARVYGVWSVTTSDSDNGLTASTGKVSLSSNLVKKSSGQRFVFTITSITMNGCTYETAANVVNSGQITT